ncbi:fused MFS/spermidine synthase [Thiomicrorhabdus sp. ZW0627]|uniref:spermidine synthase n=1 Tax=Thiomicrorhabdus sp. ZW0627 TaxID=3039774 RepID=UPI002436578F|nr:fused MFS/spermidine synthase [Thiomicrorhabdus sp. ZW0627]MDG6773712.1 fused MFS/spermidine synthase [Thiomicrorhabdus sp. ZW0627]
MYNGFTIFSTEDEFGTIKVVENRSTRKLYFDSPVEQSCFFLNAPMTLNFEYQQKIIDLLLKFAEKPPFNDPEKPFRVLMLGLGGGSMAHHLYHTLPNLQMTVVELRQAVIDCAYRFFQLPDEPEIETVQGDALEFVAENDYGFDAVIVDLFDSHGIPAEFSEEDFQKNLLKQLNPTGLLIFNLWNKQSENATQKKPAPTKESGQVLNHWQNLVSSNKGLSQNRYNINSSDNLILAVEQNC